MQLIEECPAIRELRFLLRWCWPVSLQQMPKNAVLIHQLAIHIAVRIFTHFFHNRISLCFFLSHAPFLIPSLPWSAFRPSPRTIQFSGLFWMQQSCKNRPPCFHRRRSISYHNVWSSESCWKRTLLVEGTVLSWKRLKVHWPRHDGNTKHPRIVSLFYS